MMWLYAVVFLSALTVDVIPLIAPSAWMVAAISVGKIPLAPVDRIAVLRFGFNPGAIPDESLHPRFAGLFIKRHKTDELAFLGKKLSESLWQSWIIVLFTP